MKHKHADAMALYARDAQETDRPGELWEFRYAGSTEWQNFLYDSPAWIESIEYRRKPPKQKFIKIGDRWGPEPMRVAPEEGTKFWTVSVPRILIYIWNGRDYQNQDLANGFCHFTYEAAQQHLDALIKLNNQVGVER